MLKISIMGYAVSSAPSRTVLCWEKTTAPLSLCNWGEGNFFKAAQESLGHLAPSWEKRQSVESPVLVCSPNQFPSGTKTQYGVTTSASKCTGDKKWRCPFTYSCSRGTEPSQWLICNCSRGTKWNRWSLPLRSKDTEPRVSQPWMCRNTKKSSQRSLHQCVWGLSNARP